MEKISAVIITFNEEKKLSRCLASVSPVADEIIVLDSYSSDNTAAIAKNAGAIVYHQIFSGYKEQKNLALSFTSDNYVLSLDADEALSVELINSILTEKEQFRYKAYRMNRANFYCGKYIKHGLWYPDRKIRLFDKRIAKWGGINPHDKIELKETTEVCQLEGDLLHYSYDSAEEHKRRDEEISNVAAISLFQAGVRKHWFKLILSPVWRFLKGYVFKRGFLDGYYGYRIATQTARQSYLKYKKLAQLWKSDETKNWQGDLQGKIPFTLSKK